jgi:outer membrane lipoprotein-sorting protein
MKKIAFLFTALMLVSGTFLSAQSLDDVLKEHFAAIGQEKLLKVTSVKTTGKLVQSGLEIPFIQMSKRPDCVRVEGTFQGLSFIQTFNGKEGWNLNPFAGVTDPQPMTDDELKNMKYSGDIDGMLWNWKDKGYTVTLEGKEDMEGTSCFKVKLATKDGDVFTFYLDAESYMMIRSNTKIKVQGNETESDTYFSNYMQVEGLAMPGKVDTKVNGQIVMTIVTDKVEVNTELDKALFEKPVK